MQNDLLKSSPNRNKINDIKNVYNCIFCGKLSGVNSMEKRKITHRTVHINCDNIYQFCSRKCKMNWLLKQQKENKNV